MMTVPHSGTSFMMRMFRDNGFECIGLHDEVDAQRVVYCGHTVLKQAMDKGLELYQRMPMVLVFRHPMRVTMSWKRKGKDMQELRAAFCNMNKLLDMDHIPVFVDSVKRDETFKLLEARVGRELKVDWTRIIRSKSNTYTMQVPDDTSEHYSYADI